VTPDTLLPLPAGGPPAAAVTLRTATPADAAPLAAFAAAAFHDTYGPTSRAADVAAYVDAHFAPALQHAELADPATTTWLAEHAGAVIGYAQLRRRPGWPDAARWDHAPPAAPHVELARLYVDRAWHGRGLGARLLAAVAAAAADAGAATLWLCAWQGNARAVAFYRRLGFVPVGTATFAMGDEVQHDWVMARPLAAAGR
jgi:ribosomal protein S18 acetylase RimI-like enzyme